MSPRQRLHVMLFLYKKGCRSEHLIHTILTGTRLPARMLVRIRTLPKSNPMPDRRAVRMPGYEQDLLRGLSPRHRFTACDAV